MDNYKMRLEKMIKKEVMTEFNKYITLQVAAKQVLKNIPDNSDIPCVCRLAVQDIVDICTLNLYLIKEEIAKRDY